MNQHLSFGQMDALTHFYSLNKGHMVFVPFNAFPHYPINPFPITYNSQYFPIGQVQSWPNEPQNQEFKYQPNAGQGSQSAPKIQPLKQKAQRSSRAQVIQQESDYEPMGQAIKNQIKGQVTFNYTRKNTESNIANQTLSFTCCRQKSQVILRKLYRGNDLMIDTFYELMKKIKKGSKKYINRKFLIDLAKLKPKNIGYRLLTKPPGRPSKKRSAPLSEILPPQEFKRAFRIMCLYYLRNICLNSVLLSKKINKQTWKPNLEKKRQTEQEFIKCIRNDTEPFQNYQ